MNNIKICNLCKGTNIKTLVPKLRKIDPNINIIVGCQNFCGIGYYKSFAIVNNIPIKAENEDELIKKIHSVLLH